ncbi:hypothetical protein CR513_24603, partial [Mucuna pruriens]
METPTQDFFHSIVSWRRKIIILEACLWKGIGRRIHHKEEANFGWGTVPFRNIGGGREYVTHCMT